MVGFCRPSDPDRCVVLRAPRVKVSTRLSVLAFSEKPVSNQVGSAAMASKLLEAVLSNSR